MYLSLIGGLFECLIFKVFPNICPGPSVFPYMVYMSAGHIGAQFYLTLFVFIGTWVVLDSLHDHIVIDLPRSPDLEGGQQYPCSRRSSHHSNPLGLTKHSQFYKILVLITKLSITLRYIVAAFRKATLPISKYLITPIVNMQKVLNGLSQFKSCMIWRDCKGEAGKTASEIEPSAEDPWNVRSGVQNLTSQHPAPRRGEQRVHGPRATTVLTPNNPEKPSVCHPRRPPGEIHAPLGLPSLRRARAAPEHASGCSYSLGLYHNATRLVASLFAREDDSPSAGCKLRRANGSVRRERGGALITVSLSGALVDAAGTVLVSAQGGKRSAPACRGHTAAHNEDADEPVYFFNWARHNDLLPVGSISSSPHLFFPFHSKVGPFLAQRTHLERLSAMCSELFGVVTCVCLCTDCFELQCDRVAARLHKKDRGVYNPQGAGPLEWPLLS
ncbi:hypothetical protein BU15DRAFT_64335 [Melanogaster broomeanus]|nr:hypothetical protein BU15DRAFT_64335 [Melanogaster broomeanus]